MFVIDYVEINTGKMLQFSISTLKSKMSLINQKIFGSVIKDCIQKVF